MSRVPSPEQRDSLIQSIGFYPSLLSPNMMPELRAGINQSQLELHQVGQSWQILLVIPLDQETGNRIFSEALGGMGEGSGPL